MSSCQHPHPACLQVVMELHDVGDRLQAATDLLEAQGFSVHTQRDFPALNVMIYAQKSEKSVAALASQDVMTCTCKGVPCNLCSSSRHLLIRPDHK